ncbi:SGNH/GDSL hydrolase family protein [[Acholeplasma] multilocale]|uniref:SGNH/GDSL hydrolase family protein n=1 Tax=[Acholeplasma] multilocale TaxID=264638 RepID=UPI00047E89AF|nr:SGNH/GDSL hydrolase family protein [[Acholeplasma] multilocale]
MRKLLNLLGAILMAISPLSILGYRLDNNDGDDDLEIGTDIDKSEAIDDSVQGKMFTNFYTIGDSLSDNGTLTMAITEELNVLKHIVIANERLTNQITKLLTEEQREMFYKVLEIGKEGDIKLQFGGFSANKAGLGTFTNGKTAATLLAEMLEIEDFTPGYDFNKFSTRFVKHGKNYATGGTVAYKADGMMGFVVNDFRIVQQAKNLVKQHVIHPTDLVLFEIGGNDLFAMIGKKEEQQAKLMSKIMVNIRNTLLILINNGVRNIIAINCPDIAKIPAYVNGPQELEASRISAMFNDAYAEVVEHIAERYPEVNIQHCNLKAKLNHLLSLYQSIGNNVTDPAFMLGKAPENSAKEAVTLEINQDKTEVIVNVNAHRIDDNADQSKFFFWDVVHPSKEIHEIIGKDIYKLAEKMAEENKRLNGEK